MSKQEKYALIDLVLCYVFTVALMLISWFTYDIELWVIVGLFMLPILVGVYFKYWRVYNDAEHK